MPQKQYIEILDYLKGFGMLTIVVFHLFQYMDLPDFAIVLIKFGGAGVHTFIFISGFGLYLSHLKHPMPFFEFIKKRFLKVYIPYIITVSLIGIVGFFIPFDPYNTWEKYFSHVFLYKMFSEKNIGTFGYHFWFISVIFELYLVFPLLVIFRKKMSGTGFLITGIIVSLLWSLLVLILNKAALRVWNSFFLQYVWEFMLGMWFAENIHSKGLLFLKIKKINLFLMAVIGSVIYITFSLKLGLIGKMLNDIPSLIGYTSFGILLYKLNLKWLNKFFVFTGVISFSLYLIHYAIKLLFKYELEKFGFQYNIAFLVVTLIVCYIIAYFYDKGIKKFYQLIHY
jgi:peptidoglycan/LPS O-acetylase OafA/YrhL